MPIILSLLHLHLNVEVANIKYWHLSLHECIFKRGSFSWESIHSKVCPDHSESFLVSTKYILVYSLMINRLCGIVILLFLLYCNYFDILKSFFFKCKSHIMMLSVKMKHKMITWNINETISFVKKHISLT